MKSHDKQHWSTVIITKSMTKWILVLSEIKSILVLSEEIKATRFGFPHKVHMYHISSYLVTFPQELLTQLGQPSEEHGCLSGGSSPSQAAAGRVLAPPLASRRLQDTCLLRQPSPQVTEHLDHTDTAQL